MYLHSGSHGPYVVALGRWLGGLAEGSDIHHTIRVQMFKHKAST